MTTKLSQHTVVFNFIPVCENRPGYVVTRGSKINSVKQFSLVSEKCIWKNTVKVSSPKRGTPKVKGLTSLLIVLRP